MGMRLCINKVMSILGLVYLAGVFFICKVVGHNANVFLVFDTVWRELRRGKTFSEKRIGKSVVMEIKCFRYLYGCGQWK